MKKYISFILSLAVAFTLMPCVFAAEVTVSEVVPYKYDDVRDFSDGMAAVAVRVAEGHYKWGFIDKTGKEIVPCKYDNPYTGDPYARLLSFSEGLAPVCIIPEGKTFMPFDYPRGKWGYIDKTGKEVIPLQYDVAGFFSEGLAAVGMKNGKETIIRAGGGGVVGTNYHCDHGYIDKTGKLVIPFLPYTVACAFAEGMAAVKDENDKWGYIDKTGKLVVPCRYDYARDFSEGMASVAVKDAEGHSVWGFIDKTGNEVIPIQYGGAGSFHEGMVAVSVERDFDAKYNFIDKTGKVVLSPKRDAMSAGSFSEGLAGVDGQYWGDTYFGKGFIDKTGREVIPFIYNSVQSFSEGFALVIKAGEYGFIDKTGKEVVTPQYQYARSVYDGMAAIAEGKDRSHFKWGFISLSGASTPEQPSTMSGFSDVKTSDYFAESVAWAVEKGVTVGTSASTFSPDATCTQGQILTFLWRAKGEPAPAASVSDTAYYAKAAQWAKEQGLTDDFSADADCTRAMVVTYLWKLAGSPQTGASAFTDVPADAPYAQAVAWAVAQGITNGTGNGSFSPDATCTRGQIVTFLYRALAQ